MLKFLGCGSAFNTELGNTSAFWLTDNEQNLNLIDCGESVFAKIKEVDLLDDIKQVNVFISHTHSDHSGSLSTLIYYCYYILKIKVVVFYPNSDIDKILKLQGMTGEEYLYIESENVNLVEEDVKFVKNKHLTNSKCYSLLICNKLKDKRYWYSGDTTDNYIPCHKFDLIYHDISSFGGVHPKFEEFDLINRAYCDKIVMMHFDSNELITKCIQSGYKLAVDYMV